MVAVRVVILPGNGCVNIRQANWYGWLYDKLVDHYKEVIDFSCKCENMPDPFTAKESIWLPFIRKELLGDSCNIVVGHSSGAEAAMRLCEETKVAGIVLCAACHTDLGIESEAKAGYYNRPWNGESIKTNTEFRIQLASLNDRFIPFHEMEHVRNSLEPIEFHKYETKDHFMYSKFPELFDIIIKKVDFYLKQ